MAEADEALTPATPDQFRVQLSACLALVAPVGMTEDAKVDWLTAAWGTLDGIPVDLLNRGCGVARQWCDHPSKIVPSILREVEDVWKRRKLNKSEVLSAMAKMEEPPLAPEARCTPEEAERIRKAAGIKYDDDGASRSADYIPVEKRPAPTAEDYGRWGYGAPEQEIAA